MSTAILGVRASVTGREAEKADAKAWAIALIRVLVGVVFLLHGGQKLFVFGIQNVAGMMSQMGIPLPAISALVVTWVEFLGGAALLLGFGTRPAAALLLIDMLVAILKVHLKSGFFLPAGYEFALTLLILNASLLLSGGGAFALDNRIFRRRA
jgi:putative oxidoreductase